MTLDAEISFFNQTNSYICKIFLKFFFNLILLKLSKKRISETELKSFEAFEIE